jgi:toxin HigB-1
MIAPNASGKWRICFEWPKGARGPSNVEIVDYH